MNKEIMEKDTLNKVEKKDFNYFGAGKRNYIDRQEVYEMEKQKRKEREMSNPQKRV